MNTTLDDGQWIDFDTVWDVEGDDLPFIGCYMLADFPEIEDGFLTLLKPNELLTSLKTLTIEVDYPLTNVALVVAVSSTGFTRTQLVEVIYEAYVAIYAEEAVSGRYGIWGHSFGELFIEGAEITPDGRVTLHIGS